MVPLLPPDDDNPGATNSAPALNSANVNIQQPGSVNDSGQKPTVVKPGSNPYATDYRRQNPLEKFSSFTYGITLYMLSPEAMNYYTETGKLPEDSRAFPYAIIAQSGGINNASEPRGLTYTGEPGPGKDGMDLYIDDLSFTVFMIGKDGQLTSTAATEFTFKVTEPTGFTFMTRLHKLSENLNRRSNIAKSSGAADTPHLYAQKYVLGIKFYGYDVDGEMLLANTVEDSENVMNDKYAIYQRLFPISINEVKFTISGKATVYNFKSTLSSEQVAFGQKFGQINNNANLEGVSVEEILGKKDVKNPRSLVGWLNEVQNDLKDQKNVEKPVVYDIEYKKNKIYDAREIANGLLVTDSDYARETAPMMRPVTSPKDSTVKISTKADTSNSRSKLVNIGAGASIVQVIDQIIAKSSYITNTLLKQINYHIEAKTKDNPKGKFQWYSIKPVVKILSRDKQRSDWIYEITYEIIPYEIPYIKSSYVTERSKYYGPLKLYNYTLTGQNTEVLGFELEYNNLFYVENPATSNKTEPEKGSGVSKTTPKVASSAARANPSSGQLNRMADIADSVRATLLSPNDTAKATIKITGDPDFLMDTIGHKTLDSEFGKFTASNFSINPYGGQVFVEIVFKLAEDYKDNGLLDVDVNQTVLFYPQQVQSTIKNEGLIYQVNSVVSTFSRGKFEQVLDCTMVPENELIKTEDKGDEREKSSQATTATPGTENNGQVNPRLAATQANAPSEASEANSARVNPVQSASYENSEMESQNEVYNSEYEDGAYDPASYPTTQVDDDDAMAGRSSLTPYNSSVDDYLSDGSPIREDPELPYAGDLENPEVSTIVPARVGESVPYEGKL